MDRKLYLTGLLISCPFKESLGNCPFNEFRNASIDKLIAYTNGIKDQDVILMVDYHKKCKAARESALKES